MTVLNDLASLYEPSGRATGREPNRLCIGPADLTRLASVMPGGCTVQHIAERLAGRRRPRS
jgi:hypothetical protein